MVGWCIEGKVFEEKREIIIIISSSFSTNELARVSHYTLLID